jgi:hypothetical protein
MLKYANFLLKTLTLKWVFFGCYDSTNRWKINENTKLILILTFSGCAGLLLSLPPCTFGPSSAVFTCPFTCPSVVAACFRPSCSSSSSSPKWLFMGHSVVVVVVVAPVLPFPGQTLSGQLTTSSALFLAVVPATSTTFDSCLSAAAVDAGNFDAVVVVVPSAAAAGVVVDVQRRGNRVNILVVPTGVLKKFKKLK